MIRPADARLAVSIMISSSIRLSFTGAPNGWTMKTSCSRMFSNILTKVLSLENLNTSISPGLTFKYEHMAFNSSGCALPANNFRS